MSVLSGNPRPRGRSRQQGGTVTPQLTRLPAISDNEQQLAKTREQFLTAESIDPNQVRDAILGDFANFKGDQEQADDMTVVVVRLR